MMSSLQRISRLPRAFAILISAALAVTACAAPSSPPATGSQPAGGQQASGPDLRQLSGAVTMDGSSTVFPVSEAVAEEFQKATGGRVRVTVGISGTGGGFQKFCNGEIDISNASRPISAAEIQSCGAKSIGFIEVPIAFDGLSVLVSPRNDFVTSMTVSELKKMWEPAAQGTVTRWSQIRDGWPDRPFRLYGPGTDSGTFDYFTEVITGRAKDSRGDFTASEDDNVLVQGVSNDPDALGYFGYAYYNENKDRLKLVGVDQEKGKGPVLPSQETIASGTYAPLSRPIFIYAKESALERPEVQAYVRYYTDSKTAPQLIRDVGYVPFPETYYPRVWSRVEARQRGSVFGGHAAENATLDDLIRTPAMPS
jgi:phosphate transport system substrate-binding protein